jgi:hypothetical protein
LRIENVTGAKIAETMADEGTTVETTAETTVETTAETIGTSLAGTITGEGKERERFRY